MSGTDAAPMPIVELKADEDKAPAMSCALERRIRQQEILAELGVTALQGANFDQLLDDTARLTAEGMQAEFCKVLEHNPAENCFLVRAGVGWEPGIVGVATIGADLASPKPSIGITIPSMNSRRCIRDLPPDRGGSLSRGVARERGRRLAEAAGHQKMRAIGPGGGRIEFSKSPDM
jgi:hypothetical protein